MGNGQTSTAVDTRQATQIQEARVIVGRDLWSDASDTYLRAVAANAAGEGEPELMKVERHAEFLRSLDCDEQPVEDAPLMWAILKMA